MARQFNPTPEGQTLYMEEFRSTRYLALGAHLVASIRKNFEARAELHVFQNIREINKRPDFTAEWGNYFFRTRFITSTGLVYHTPVGPVSLIFNYYHGTSRPYSLMFNIGYIIHNKPAFD